ncbi:MAG: HlyD family efflux transporter periplasmic adaptor subunit, partial [Anaerolineae bacterium]|nr:HlyD family efflux transporter periplasmic adaptor subunit [Anaerolineae bacterium]NIN99721.1 HlyD family efflux transporter periplasmic adaptor subunit [Anaerolineae bacterium]
RSVHVGETASPGGTLLAIANLDEVKLTVYIPENRFGRIQLGQPVSVGVDSFPGKAYEGEVVYISSEAEFTPRNVQTQEERVNTVFAVKI